MSKSTKPKTAVAQVEQEQAQRRSGPIIPGIDKQIILSVMVDFTNRCRAAIENSVRKHMDAHKDDPEALKDASLYMDGANMMHNLIMQGLLNAPQVQPRPAPTDGTQHADKNERRAKAQEQHKEVQ